MRALKGIKGPKAKLLAPGSQLFNSPDGSPQTLGPERDWIHWLKASEKPTFRPWEDTYPTQSILL